MSLIPLNLPGNLEPASQNMIPFVVSSTLATQSNFRYIFDVYTLDQVSSSPIFKTRVNPFPRPDSSGLYSPHYVLRDNVSYNLQPFISSPTGNSQSIVHYKLNIGEQYNPGKTWASTRNESGFLGITFSATHSFLAGDIILIDKYDKSINPQYDGTASITSIPNGLEIITNKTFTTASTVEQGIITDLLRMSYTSSVYRAFNGTRQYDQQGLDYEATYVTDINSKRYFLTYYGGIKGLYSTDYQTLSYIAATQGIQPNIAVFKFYNKGIITATFGMTVSVSNYKRIDIPTGYQNALSYTDPTLASNMLTTINNGVNGLYTVQMATWSGYPSGSPTYMNYNFTYSFNKNYDRGSALDCNSPTKREYSIIELSFLNSLGAFEYMSFALVSKTSIKVQRKMYKQVLAYNYIIGDRGNTIFDQNITEELSLTSDWLTDAEALQVAELVKSPEVYIISQYDPIAMTTNINKYPVIVTSDSYTIKNTLNDVLFNFNISVAKAYTIYSNV